MLYLSHDKPHRTPWNKGKLTEQKPPLKLNEVWAIRIRLQIAKKTRDLALDSKIRSCDLVKLKVSDVAPMLLPRIVTMSVNQWLHHL